VTLSDDEAREIGDAHGTDKVYRTRWGEWRTRVKRGRCVMLVDNACTIHATSYFPAVCRGFPWTEGDGVSPYRYDRTICPEFAARPELVELGRATTPRRTA
jgi:hypothetical protein